MSYKEYILLRKKYMETDYNNSKVHNNTVNTFKNIEVEKEKIKNKNKEDKKKS